MDNTPTSNANAGDNPVADPALRELEALLDRSAALDARAALDLPGSARGRSLEDRIHASTRDVLSETSPVIATIGKSESRARVWRIAAAIGVVASIGILYSATRPQTVVKPDGTGVQLTTRTSSDVEYVLAAVSLLDEPLGSGIDDLMADATRLHELVTSDREIGAAQTSEEKPAKQGV